MTQPGQFRIWPRLGLRGWIFLILWLTILVAVVITFTLIAFGIFLFLLPALAIVTLLYYLFPSPRRAPARRSEDATIIDGEFRVVEPRKIEQEPPKKRDENG